MTSPSHRGSRLMCLDRGHDVRGVTLYVDLEKPRTDSKGYTLTAVGKGDGRIRLGDAPRGGIRVELVCTRCGGVVAVATLRIKKHGGGEDD